MATVKKIKKAQGGSRLCKWSSKRGGGVSCGRGGGPKQDTWKSPRIKFSKSDDNEPVVTGRKPKEVGVWHKEWDSDESIPKNLKSGFYKEKMKKGGKVSKKAVVKKSSTIKKKK